MPSKKFILVVSVILMMYAGWFFVSAAKNYLVEKTMGQDKNGDGGIAGVLGLEKQINTKNDLASGVASLDSDSDGLKDWEESLWGTDPNKADTDGDGYTDKEEVDGGYDPLDARSNPKTGVKKEGDNQNAKQGVVQNNGATNNNAKVAFVPENSDPKNFAASIASSISAKVMNSPKSKPDFSNVNDLINNNMARALEEYSADFNLQLSDGDLKVSKDNSSAAVKKYIKALSDLANDPHPEMDGDTIFSNTLETKDFTVVDDYTRYIDDSVDKLKQIVVPSDFFAAHKRQIELLLATKQALASLKEIDKDAMKTLLGYQEYLRIRDEIFAVNQKINDLAKSHISG